jgi:putative ABC transport system ATP-binding protein
MSETHAFELTAVSFAYDDGFALEVDQLRIAVGERVACIGPSGTGKTTLVRLMTGELLPAAGAVHFCGDRVSSMSDDKRRAMRISRIGLVFQEFELIEYLSARDNILLPYHVGSGLQVTRAVQERAAGLARSAGIEHVLRRPPRRLSQGERQRVAICRSLITEPQAILCDEPTGNLDPGTAEQVLDLVLQHCRDRNATLFMVTHNHGILDRFDRTVDITRLGSAERVDEASS